MGKRLVLVLFACAAFGLCAWFLRVGISGQVAEAHGAGPRERAPAPLPRTPVALEVPSVRSTATPLAPGVTASESARTEPRVGLAPAPARAEEDGEAGGIAVRIIGPEGAPVEGAEVLVLANANDETLKKFWDSSSVDELMDSEGRASETNAAGLLNVPAPEQGRRTLLLGRRGPLWGSLSLRHDPERTQPVELTLELDVTLRARVVDMDGVPVPGIAVQLLQVDSWDSWAASEALTRGDEAIAVLRHAQEVFDDDPQHYWALGLDALFEPAIEHVLDQHDLPTGVVTLVLPAVGAVDVVVQGSGGAPFEGEARATLAIVRDGDPDELSPFSGIRRPTVGQPVVGGVARFPFVEPGRRLEVAVSRAGSGVETRVHGPGPAGAGQTRTFEVRLGADHPVALLRAVDDSGRPVPDAELIVTISIGSKYIHSADEVSARTDAAGAFLVDLESDWSEGMRRDLIVKWGSDGPSAISGRVDVSMRLRNGINDLGVVRLEPPPLFVAGRVVTSSGEPLAGARLVLQTRAAQDSRWQQSWDFTEHSDDSGAFEVRGRLPGDELRLGASSKGHAGPAREFVRGESDLVLELESEGTLAGQVLVDEGFPCGDLVLELVGEIDYLDYEDRRRSIEADGTFRFEKLVRGEYGLRVRFENHSGTVESVEGIPVAAGETSRDPRLDPLDLRGRIRAHRVILTHPAGERVRGQLRYGAVGAEKLESSRWFHAAEFWLVCELERMDLQLDSPRYLTRRLEDVGGEIRLELTPSPRVRLVLDPTVQLPDPPVYIKAVLTPVAGAEGGIDWAAAAFDEEREISVSVPGSGEMNVTWVVEHRGSGGNVARGHRVEPAQIVTVSGELDQRIEVSLTPEQLAEILADR